MLAQKWAASYTSRRGYRCNYYTQGSVKNAETACGSRL
jgi:hypothetical protein